MIHFHIDRIFAFKNPCAIFVVGIHVIRQRKIIKIPDRAIWVFENIISQDRCTKLRRDLSA